VGLDLVDRGSDLVVLDEVDQAVGMSCVQSLVVTNSSSRGTPLAAMARPTASSLP